MSTKLNEFSIDLPITALSAGTETVPSMDVPAASVVPTLGSDPLSMTIGAPTMPPVDPKSVTVYANSINPISFESGADGIAAFDVVFSVGVSCGDGTCKTYQVVKRIGIDKARIAAEVEQGQPMSIVEAKKEEPLKESTAISQAKRFRQMAGLE